MSSFFDRYWWLIIFFLRNPIFLGYVTVHRFSPKYFDSSNWVGSSVCAMMKNALTVFGIVLQTKKCKVQWSFLPLGIGLDGFLLCFLTQCARRTNGEVTVNKRNKSPFVIVHNVCSAQLVLEWSISHLQIVNEAKWETITCIQLEIYHVMKSKLTDALIGKGAACCLLFR